MAPATWELVRTVSAPEEYFQELREELLRAESQEKIDQLLDEWFDAENRATDYDAVKWGFDPELWCREERKKMESKIARSRVRNGSSK